MRLKLRTQILLVAVLPTLLLGLVIGGYLLTTRVADLHDSQQKLGNTIVSYLAPASEFAVLSGNRQMLERLTRRLVEQEEVTLVRITDAEGRLQAESRSRERPVNVPRWMDRIYPIDSASLRFHSDIRIADDPIGDFEELFGGNRRASTAADTVIGHLVVELSAAPLLARQVEVLRFGVLLILVGLLLSFAIATRAGLNIVNPINRVVQAFKEFGNGRLDTRLTVRSRGETALLEQGFNDLATEIQQSRERMEAQIEQATSDLRETLEAVEIQNVELDLARKRAEQSNRVKSEFLANISHEIRTPMNAIFGYTQLLARTSTDDPQRDYIQTIQRSAESLLALLEDVLNLSRIEAGRVEVDKTTFDPEELLEEIITIMAPSAHEKDLDLIWHPRSRLPARVIGDPVKLRQIVSNLLSNACKFTEQGSITLEAEIRHASPTDSRLHLAVTDTGIGISPADHSRLFQAFSQLDSSSARRHQGAGLGLVICDQLTRLMGGHIRVDSEPGQGSCFSVEIPIKIDSEPSQAPAEPYTVCLVSSHQGLLKSIASRLSNLGCEVSSVHISADPAVWSDVFSGLVADRDISVLALPRQEVLTQSTLTALKQALAESPYPKERWLIMAGTKDRQEAQQLEQQLGSAWLPLTLSADALRKALKATHEGKAPRLETTASQDSQSSSLHRLDDLKLMVVEDNRINRHLVLEFLQSAGGEARAAEDGHEALAMAADWKPDVVLMDIQLPGMDGLETSQRLRADYAFDDIPILALTASASEEEHRRCLDGGLDGVLVKPVRAEAMIDRIKRAIGEYDQTPRPARHGSERSHPRPAPETEGNPAERTVQPMGRDASGRLRPDIAGMVKKDLPEQLQTAREHLARNAFNDLDSVIHTMKGTAAFCGFHALQAACEGIREALHDNEEVDATTLEAALERVAGQVGDVLKKI